MLMMSKILVIVSICVVLIKGQLSSGPRPHEWTTYLRITSCYDADPGELKKIKFECSRSLLETAENAYCNQYPPHFSTRIIIKVSSCEHIQQFLVQLQPSEGLEEINLASNRIASINGFKFNQFSSLISLDMSNNCIEDIPLVNFVGLSNLLRLNLQKNAIEHIPSNALLALSSLEELNLAHNRIKDISLASFVGSSRLTHLNLQNNFIENIPSNAFAVLWNMEELNLSHNRIQTIGKSARSTNSSRLIMLDLSFNEITELKAWSFENFNQLTLLNISHSQLVSIEPDTFSPMKMLTALDLSNNFLERIDFSRRFSQMEFLILNKNDLTEFQKDIFTVFPNLHTLKITDNRFNCTYVTGITPMYRTILNVESDCINSTFEDLPRIVTALQILLWVMLLSLILLIAGTINFINRIDEYVEQSDYLELTSVHCNVSDVTTTFDRLNRVLPILGTQHLSITLDKEAMA